MKNKLPWVVAAAALVVALVALLVALRSASLADGYVSQMAGGTMPSPTPAVPGAAAGAQPAGTAVPSGTAAPSPTAAASPAPEPSGHSLSVRVVDPTGQPVPGATVRLMFDVEGRKVTSSVLGDATGGAVVRGIGADQVDAISVEADGYERSDISASIPLPLDEVFTITLTALAGTRVRVLAVADGAPDGKPYEGPATIYLMRRAGDDATTDSPTRAPSHERYETVESRETRVAGGLHRVDEVPPGTYRAAVTVGDDYAESEPFSVQPGVASETVVVLGRRQTLPVSVTAAGGREPVAGAQVRARMTSRPPAAGVAAPVSATTTAQGTVDLPGLAPGVYAVEVSAPGFATKTVEEVRVTGAGAQPPLAVALAQGTSSVTVTVSDGDGRPIARAPLVLFAGAAAGPRTFFGETDDAGTFRFDPVPAGRYTLSANHPESRSRLQRTAEVVVGDADARQVSVSFRKTQSLQGRARRAGKPFEGLVSFVARTGDGTRHYARADENGEFVVEMEPGEYVVGREDQPGNSMVTIVPGQTAVEVEIR